jgi:hypothetical protein
MYSSFKFKLGNDTSLGAGEITIISQYRFISYYSKKKTVKQKKAHLLFRKFRTQCTNFFYVPEFWSLGHIFMSNKGQKFDFPLTFATVAKN